MGPPEWELEGRALFERIHSVVVQFFGPVEKVLSGDQPMDDEVENRTVDVLPRVMDSLVADVEAWGDRWPATNIRNKDFVRASVMRLALRHAISAAHLSFLAIQLLFDEDKRRAQLGMDAWRVASETYAHAFLLMRDTPAIRAKHLLPAGEARRDLEARFEREFLPMLARVNAEVGA